MLPKSLAGLFYKMKTYPPHPHYQLMRSHLVYSAKQKIVIYTSNPVTFSVNESSGVTSLLLYIEKISTIRVRTLATYSDSSGTCLRHTSRPYTSTNILDKTPEWHEKGLINVVTFTLRKQSRSPVRINHCQLVQANVCQIS